ncbi:MAG TPA: TRAM domain-containing protein [Candidatus Saccharimonadales bacterium]|nr:TRAM domain-containing protein [Candidatus Saccharimonadales bacterium]
MIELLQTIILIFVAWFLVSKNSDHIFRVFGGRQRKIILDSCALIDGRVVPIVNSGFASDELVIPQFILNELQMLADGNDSHKRERARYGLDVANQLQDAAPVKVTIDRTVFEGAPAIDDKLVLLAKKLRAQLYTTDYNLGKVAAVEGVRVLNVNELAQSLRPITLPGETLKIKIIQKGSNHGQGVGYLEDGTMIVVDGASRHVGRVVPVTVTRMHQTVAGKMVFGQVRSVENADHDDEAQQQAKQQPANQAASARIHQQGRASMHNKLHGRLQRVVKRRNPAVNS